MAFSKPEQERLKELTQLRSQMAKRRKQLKKELALKRELQKQQKEIRELKEQLHPSAKTKLEKFLLTTSKAVGELGKGVSQLGKEAQKFSQESQRPKVRVIRASGETRREKQTPRRLLDMI